MVNGRLQIIDPQMTQIYADFLATMLPICANLRNLRIFNEDGKTAVCAVFVFAGEMGSFCYAKTPRHLQSDGELRSRRKTAVYFTIMYTHTFRASAQRNGWQSVPKRPYPHLPIC